MCRKLFYAISVLVLSLACNSYGLVLGDFETGLDGWVVNNWDTPLGSIEQSTVGATLGSNSLKINAPWTGWKIAAFVKLQQVYTDPNVLAAVTAEWLNSSTLSLDVTIDPADWPTTNPNAWLNIIVISNSEKGGWYRFNGKGKLSDNVNPGSPGGWDPVNFPTVQTRHLVCDLTEVNNNMILAGGPGGWFEVFICVNSGGFPNGGVLYIDNLQVPEPPPPPPPGLVHQYTFEDGTAKDSIGGADGTLAGDAYIADGALVTVDQDDWMEMSGDVIAMNTYNEVTIEAWYTPEAGANTGWSMLGYFGDSVNGLGSNGYFMTSARGDNKSRAAISIGDIATPWASESGADGTEYDDGLLHHMVSTINATDITLYIDGVLIATTPLSARNKISGISPNFAYLAKGGYGGDPEWIGSIQEFNIYNRALSAGEIAANHAKGPVTPLVHRYTFEDGTANDSVGGADGTLVGDAYIADGAS